MSFRYNVTGGAELAILETVKTGYPELQDLASAIEKSMANDGEISTMRMNDPAVQQILAHDGGIILFLEGRLGKTKEQLMLPLK